MKSRQPRAELRVQSIEDDGWTWSYVEPEHDVELYSNETYATAEGAKDWARRAYPDVPFAEDGGDGDGQDDGENTEG
jgi:hypothetical protein